MSFFATKCRTTDELLIWQSLIDTWYFWKRTKCLCVVCTVLRVCENLSELVYPVEALLFLHLTSLSSETSAKKIIGVAESGIWIRPYSIRRIKIAWLLPALRIRIRMIGSTLFWEAGSWSASKWNAGFGSGSASKWKSGSGSGSASKWKDGSLVKGNFEELEDPNLRKSEW